MMKLVMLFLFFIYSSFSFVNQLELDLSQIIDNQSLEDEVKISPVLLQVKNVFAKYEKGYYQGIDSEEQYQETLKEVANEICEYIGYTESADFEIDYRSKPKGEESNTYLIHPLSQMKLS